MYISNIKRKIDIDKSIAMILLIMLSIIPLVMYKCTVWGVGPKILNSIYDTGVRNEFFNYSKFKVLLFLTSIVFILFLYRTFVMKVNLKSTKVNILLLFIIVPIMLSSVFSKYKYISLFGNNERFEGSLSWICYCIIFFVLYNIRLSNKMLDILKFTNIPFLIVNVILALLSFYGVNILSFEWFYKMIGSQSEINGRLITTLYNQNFSSGVGAVLFISSLVYILFEENNKNRIYGLVTAVLSLSLILLSLSLSGFVTIVVISPIVVISSFVFTRKKIVIKWVSALLILCSIIFMILNSHNNSIYNESIGFFVKLCSSIEHSDTVDSNNDNEKNSVSDTLVEAGSGRVHIWKETINLIKDEPILGYGFDTYPYVIDHNKPENSMWLIDKPHNLFLTIAFGCGFIGLFGIISIIIYTIVNTIKSLIHRRQHMYLYLSFFVVLTYCFQGLFNDSFIGTSIIFWVYLGIYVNVFTNKNMQQKICRKNSKIDDKKCYKS